LITSERQDIGNSDIRQEGNTGRGGRGERASRKQELEKFEIRKAKSETNLNDKSKKFETV